MKHTWKCHTRAATEVKCVVIGMSPVRCSAVSGVQWV